MQFEKSITLATFSPLWWESILWIGGSIFLLIQMPKYLKNIQIKQYNLDVIISVGYRVKSQRGTQFRQWATARLSEYLVKGFTMDDERLKNPPGKGQQDYFDELLERIRDIRSSERSFYQKVLDI